MVPPTKDSVRSTYDAIAESYAAARKDPWPEVLAFLDQLPPARRIVDVGCGHGRHVVAGTVRGHSVVGIDFSRRLLSIGRGRLPLPDSGPRIGFVEADASVLPFRPASFDVALAIAMLHHLPNAEDRLQVLREVRRVLVPGGIAFFSVWDINGPRFRAVRDARRQLPAEIQGDVDVPWNLPDGRVIMRHYHLFRDGELERLIIEAGLHTERFFQASGNRFAVASRRA